MARTEDVLDEDETLAAARGRVIELALGRRDALRILESVLRAEEADVDRRTLDLGEEHRARFAIRRRKIFEEKHLEALVEELVAAHKVAERLPLGRELLLRTADEDPLLHAAPDPMIAQESSVRPQMKLTILLCWDGSIPRRKSVFVEGADSNRFRLPQAIPGSREPLTTATVPADGSWRVVFSPY